MKFGRFKFESFKEFQHIQNLAIEKGARTNEEFEKFLSDNYSDKLVKEKA